MSKKIAFFSFADIDNFGDILFSHIFKMEMEKRISDVQIDFYTPSNYSVEGIDYKAYSRDKIIQGEYDALVVFGGEVIHLFDERTWQPIYDKNGQSLESSLPSDVIFDWVNIEKPFKAWISVGARPIEDEESNLKIQSTIEKLDYISVRGNLSKKILEEMKLQLNNTKIEITPDLGWLFPDLLDYNHSRGMLYKNFVGEGEYLIFQINNISDAEAEEIGGYLLDFKKKSGLNVILLPVIRPWEDAKYLKNISDKYPEEFLLLNNDLSIIEMADILVHASLVLTSSLHANITALSAGIPSGIINKWQGTKLQDLYGHQFRLAKVKHQLKDIPELLNSLLLEKENDLELLSLYAQFMKSSLMKVFNNLVKIIC